MAAETTCATKFPSHGHLVHARQWMGVDVAFLCTFPDATSHSQRVIMPFPAGRGGAWNGYGRASMNMYNCIYVCMYVYIYVYVHVCAYMCMRVVGLSSSVF